LLDKHGSIQKPRPVTNRFSWNTQTYESIAMVQRLASMELLEKLEVLGPNKAGRDVLAEVRSVLDIGCGTGWLAVFLARRLPGGTVTGVDISPAMVARARELALSEAVRNMRVEEQDAELMEFSGEFDLVTSNAAFHWMRNAGNLLERVYRSMRPGAMLAVQFPLLTEAHPMVHTMNRAIATAGLQAHYLNWEFPWYRTTPEAYRELLLERGFEVSVVEQCNEDFYLSKEEFLAFFSAVGQGLYFSGLNEADTARLGQAYETEVEVTLGDVGSLTKFIRLFALARKPAAA
jgi:trans-aconitate 2-methyltransferase